MKTHGMWRTSEYEAWHGILQRCNNPNHPWYHSYGGRKITVCERWLKFENFYADMGDCPEGLTIERIDNDEGYYSGNCKWATPTEQQRNKRLNKNNKTGIPGVNWDKRSQKYLVRITVNHKGYFIKLCKTLKQAAIVRKQAELKYWDSK